MATDKYYSPVSGNDTTGDGSSGTPYATTQKCLDNITAAAGDRIIGKGGETDDLGGTKLSFATYGTPSGLAFMGGESLSFGTGRTLIDGNGGSIIDDTSVADFLTFLSMDLKNSGASASFLIRSDNTLRLIDCILRDDPVDTDQNAFIAFSTFLTGAGVALTLHGGAVVFCDFSGVGSGISQTSPIPLTVAHNSISLASAGSGFGIQANNFASVFGNAIYGNVGTGSGITTVAAALVDAILNNAVSGFSGAGGKGIVVASGVTVNLYGGNSANDNTTNFDTSSGTLVHDLGGNVTTAVLTSPSTGDFSSTGDGLDGGLPAASPNFAGQYNLNIGALMSVAGGGGGVPGNMMGGLQ